MDGCAGNVLTDDNYLWFRIERRSVAAVSYVPGFFESCVNCPLIENGDSNCAPGDDPSTCLIGYNINLDRDTTAGGSVAYDIDSGRFYSGYAANAVYMKRIEKRPGMNRYVFQESSLPANRVYQYKVTIMAEHPAGTSKPECVSNQYASCADQCNGSFNGLREYQIIADLAAVNQCYPPVEKPYAGGDPNNGFPPLADQGDVDNLDWSTAHVITTSEQPWAADANAVNDFRYINDNDPSGNIRNIRTNFSGAGQNGNLWSNFNTGVCGASVTGSAQTLSQNLMMHFHARTGIADQVLSTAIRGNYVSSLGNENFLRLDMDFISGTNEIGRVIYTTSAGGTVSLTTSTTNPGNNGRDVEWWSYFVLACSNQITGHAEEGHTYVYMWGRPDPGRTHDWKTGTPNYTSTTPTVSWRSVGKNTTAAIKVTGPLPPGCGSCTSAGGGEFNCPSGVSYKCVVPRFGKIGWFANAYTATTLNRFDKIRIDPLCTSCPPPGLPTPP
ncbi:MAG: hypothetical protein M5R36_12615 [Deltaproteobacteria bacterium]|nr:hypothetical protein [Deltaproteobacteria bacterium]